MPNNDKRVFEIIMKDVQASRFKESDKESGGRGGRGSSTDGADGESDAKRQHIYNQAMGFFRPTMQMAQNMAGSMFDPFLSAGERARRFEEEAISAGIKTAGHGATILAAGVAGNMLTPGAGAAVTAAGGELTALVDAVARGVQQGMHAEARYIEGQARGGLNSFLQPLAVAGVPEEMLQQLSDAVSPAFVAQGRRSAGAYKIAQNQNMDIPSADMGQMHAEIKKNVDIIMNKSDSRIKQFMPDWLGGG